jgi:hypothetical protein
MPFPLESDTFSISVSKHKAANLRRRECWMYPDAISSLNWSSPFQKDSPVRTTSLSIIAATFSAIPAHAQQPNANPLGADELAVPPSLTLARTPTARNQPETTVGDAGDRDAKPRSIGVELVSGGSYNFRTNLRNGGGDVSIVRAGGEVNMTLPIGRSTNLVINPGLLYSGYDFSRTNAIAPAFDKPWSDMWEFRLGATALLVQDPQWSYILGATIHSSGEQGATLSSTMTYSGIGGVRYAFSDSLALRGGLIVATRLEDHMVFLPLIGIEWRIDDHWTLANTQGRVQSEVGNGLSLGYRFSEDFELRLSGSYAAYQYRLDDAGFNPRGVVDDNRVPVALSADWNITNKCTLLTTLGVNVWQEYEVKDSDGATIRTIQTEPQPFLSFVLNIKF